MNRLNLQRVVLGIVLAAAGTIVGASVSTSNRAHGEVRGTPQPQAFQSGGQLSVPVLREIAATLHQIDARLARLETAAQRLQAPPTPGAATNAIKSLSQNRRGLAHFAESSEQNVPVPLPRDGSGIGTK